MNLIDITDATDSDLDALLGCDDGETFRCPGCGESYPVADENHDLCPDCFDYCINRPDETDSWGDHNPNYDY